MHIVFKIEFKRKIDVPWPSTVGHKNYGFYDLSLDSHNSVSV